jgi:L-fuculose-phosphate aldolase
MLLEELRREVLSAALEMDRTALTRGTSGNISARDPKTNLVAITPTSLPYNSLEPEDITIVDLDGNYIEGKKPSSETPMHTAIFRARPDVMGVVHTHSPLATAFSVANKEIPIVTIPLVSMGPIPVVPFQMPGSKELADTATAALGTAKVAVLLQNHGVLACGPSVAKALASAVYVEEGAQVALAAYQLGGMNPIDPAAIEKMRERRRKGAAL